MLTENQGPSCSIDLALYEGVGWRPIKPVGGVVVKRTENPEKILVKALTALTCVNNGDSTDSADNGNHANSGNVRLQ